MTAEKNIALIQNTYAAFGRGDVPAILENVTENVDWGVEAADSKEVPWHGTGRGRQFAAKFFEALGKAAVFTRFEPSGFVASDSNVACLVSWDAKLTHNGRTMTQNVIHYFTIENGRIAKWRGSEDTALVKATWNA
jgi:ketosteroid isomerase-like protein